MKIHDSRIFRYALMTSLGLHCAGFMYLQRYNHAMRTSFHHEAGYLEQSVMFTIGWTSQETPACPSIATQSQERKQTIITTAKSHFSLSAASDSYKKMGKDSAKLYTKPNVTNNIGKQAVAALGSSGKYEQFSSGLYNDYVAQIRKRIEQEKFFPKYIVSSHSAAAVTLRFLIDFQGLVHNITIISTSEKSIFKKTAKDILCRAAPFPKPYHQELTHKPIEITIVFDKAK